MFRTLVKAFGLILILGGIGLVADRAQAQDVERYKPRAAKQIGHARLIGPNLPAGSGDDTVLIKSLRGVVVVGRPNLIRSGGTSANGIRVRDDDLIFPAAAGDAIRNYLGAAISMKSINMMTKDIVLAYRRADRPVVNVVAPAQDISNGVLQLIIVVGRLDDVEVAGNRYFPEHIYEDNFTTPRGVHIAGDRVLDDLRWLNRNPFRRVDAVYSPGDEFGETNITLRPYELRPFTVYAGINNDGNETLGRERLFAGTMVGNLLGWDEVFGYQFTTDKSFEQLYAHVFTAQIPLTQRSELQLIGSYVTSEADINADLKTSGKSSQLGAYYIAQIPRYGGVSHDIRLGVEAKSTNNNLEFGGTIVTDTTAEIYQLLAGYSGEKFSALGHSRFGATLYYSPGGISAKNTDAVFQQQRFNASANYAYARFNFHHRVNLPSDWRLFASVEAQVASANLLASESFTLGGPGAVRGFETNVTRGDNGLAASFTVYSPGISVWGSAQVPDYLAGAFTRYDDKDDDEGTVYDTAKDQLRALAFVDFGWASSNSNLVGETDRSLASAGLGIVYEFGRYYSTELAYGWQLHEKGFVDDDSGFFHFRTTARY